MNDAFDPYHKWLGIPLHEQPADYYRLLGVQMFEPDAEVIDNAADRQMAHVQSFQTGSRSSTAQRMLNEIAAARVCLLDENQRSRYDATLRKKHRRAEPNVIPPIAAQKVSLDPGSNRKGDVHEVEIEFETATDDWINGNDVIDWMEGDTDILQPRDTENARQLEPVAYVKLEQEQINRIVISEEDGIHIGLIFTSSCLCVVGLAFASWFLGIFGVLVAGLLVAIVGLVIYEAHPKFIHERQNQPANERKKATAEVLKSQPSITLSAKILCQHCQERGYVTTRRLPGPRIRTAAQCDNCGSEWEF